MRGAMLVLLAAVLVAAGCATGGGKTAGPSASPDALAAAPDALASAAPDVLAAAGPATVIEVENFKLTKGNAVDLKDASGGKAVVLTDEAGEAEYTLPSLAKGTYELVIRGVGQSDKEDAVYVRVAGQAEERVFPEEWKKLLPFKAVRFTQPADGPCKIVLSFGEENVQLDRVEIRPVK